MNFRVGDKIIPMWIGCSDLFDPHLGGGHNQIHLSSKPYL
jgi:hypothetical protein